MKQSDFGMSAAAVGVLLKKMASRAVRAIQTQLSSFETHHKENEFKAEDVLTSADLAAQKVVEAMIKENFPNAGILGEENLRKEPTEGCNVWFTIDPLDGTKAFVREQSDGIGTLIGMVAGDEIIGAVVGDIMTDELYYYRPSSHKVHRLHPRRHRILAYKPSLKPRIQMLDDPRTYSPLVQKLSHPYEGFFASVGVTNGSIATNMARLWKGEVQAFVTKSSISHPWDIVPLVGINQKLGFRQLAIEDGKLRFMDPRETWKLESCKMPEILTVHQSMVPEIIHWLS